MKQDKMGRGDRNAAIEKEAVSGQDESREAGAKAPRSWKEYIEQNMPTQGQAEEQAAKQAPVRKKRLVGEGMGMRAKAALERLKGADAEEVKAARARLKGRAGAMLARLREAAGRAGESVGDKAWAVREKVGGLTEGGRETFGQGTAKLRSIVARHPISPLFYVTVLAVAVGVMSFRGTYIRAYAMEVNGETVAVVSSPDEKDVIVSNIESRASDILGESYDFDAEITLTPVYTVPDALSDTAEVEDTLFDGVGAYMTAYGISVDGVELGYAADKGELYQMLDEIAQPYIPADAIRYDFVQDVQVYPVELPSNTKFDLEPIRETLSALEIEEAVYEVKKGDTFNAIAYSLDMWPNELSILNPDIIVNKLWVGQELVIQQAVPYLSVEAVTDETYEEVIPSPVEYIETADLYVGETKVKEQGEDGLALVNAQVTYMNNVEMEREVITSTTLKEATTTYTYTGTTPRPVTASNGYYIWPVRGTITSNFGGRYLGGYYDFHLGIDIAVPYGTAIKASDGGTVIKAGWNGSYGKLVAIQHDNGTVTYYGHNSSVLVSVGEKVYQGQIIARAGSTGNSTGNHCHFEVRVNGTSVNPRNYLP